METEGSQDSQFHTRKHHGSLVANVQALESVAVGAITHCLTGCAIGKVLGMVTGIGLGRDAVEIVVLGVIFAFLFGCGLAMWSLLRNGVSFGPAASCAIFSDMMSITIMDIVDGTILLAVPNALDTPLSSPLSWTSPVLAVVIASIFSITAAFGSKNHQTRLSLSGNFRLHFWSGVT